MAKRMSFGSSAPRAPDEQRPRLAWQRLADVQVPFGILWWLLLGLWLRGRAMDKALEEFSRSAEDLGSLVGTRWREEDEREEKLLELQQSIETLTRRLVALTIVVGVAGLAATAATILAAVNS